MHGGGSLALELGLGEPQRFQFPYLVRISGRLCCAAPLAFRLPFFDPFLNTRIRVNKSFTRITHTFKPTIIVVPRADVLTLFHPAVAEWFRASFEAPTPPQAQGWPAIGRGESTLILAPTGSGKTLTAFLWCINRLMFEPAPAASHASDGVRGFRPASAKATAARRSFSGGWGDPADSRKVRARQDSNLRPPA